MRQQFNSRNNISKILRFQKSGSTASFFSVISFTNALRRASFKFFNGVETKQIAGNSITYTGFTSDSEIRDIEMRFYTDTSLNTLRLENDNLYGNIDFSSLSGVTNSLTLRVSGNPSLTGVTNVPPKTSIFYCMNSNLTGNLNFGSSNIGDFRVTNNIKLTGITHVTTSANTSTYNASNCDLIGDIDLTPITALGGIFNLSYNPNLTGITHTTSNRNFTSYSVNDCNLKGELNLTMLSNLGGNFAAYNNLELTGIIHIGSSSTFTFYQAYYCNLTGNLNVPFSGLGGNFNLQVNPNLTGVTHVASTNIFNGYYITNCDIIGNHDLSMLSNLGGEFDLSYNPNLTGVTHTSSTQNFTSYFITFCNLTGVHDISMLSNLGGDNNNFVYPRVQLQENPNLNNIIFPTTTKYFKNSSNLDGGACFQFYGCDLDYVNFKPLSGATLLSGVTIGNPKILLRDNNMSSADVNHILDDFKYNATNNPTGWSNINLNIGGTNSDPDSSSGGYDGLAALSFLTGSPYNWTITY
jgi:hypothetical protein